MLNSLEILTTSSLADVVICELEGMIVRGDVSAGERISEAALAKRLGISRAPVREACRALAQVGLLTQKRNRGVYVNAIGLEEALDLYEVRALVEAEMAAAAAVRRDAGLVTRLRGELEAMDLAERRQDGSDYFEHNLAFHQLLADSCANLEMKKIYRSATIRLHIHRRDRLRSRSNMSLSHRAHAELIGAIENGDKASAREIMRSHINAGRDWYRQANQSIESTDQANLS